jgi:putative pyoverdin transport system ATP-binding/permease protein
MKKLFQLLINTSGQGVAIAVLTGLLSGLASAGVIALINYAINQPDVSKGYLLLAFIGLCLTLLVSMSASLIVLGRLVQEVTFTLRMQLCQRILRCPLRHLEDVGASQLLAALTDDVEAIAAAAFLTANLCVSVAMLVACLVYLTWLSWQMSLMILGYLMLAVYSYNALLNKGRHYFKLARNGQDYLMGHFRTTVEGVKELKLHTRRRTAFLQQDLQTSATMVKTYRNRALDIFSMTGSLGLVLMFIPIGFLVIGAPQWGNLSAQAISGCALTLLFALTPLRIILNTLPELARASIALDKIATLGLSLTATGLETDPSTAQPHLKAHPQAGVLHLKEITHIYRHERDSNPFTLGPMNLTFSPGELTFIIGGNGSGKSTLVKLITGLYAPETGAIQWQDQWITADNRDWFRQHFAVVFADFYLFDRLLGLDQPDLSQQAHHYLKQLQLDHKVTLEADRFSTTALSQGQRKRLALLTAYLEDRPMYVFDEWASDQDPVFKEIFYTQLLPGLRDRGKTVLAISHDDHYFACADRIIKLDYGQVEYVKKAKA